MGASGDCPEVELWAVSLLGFAELEREGKWACAGIAVLPRTTWAECRWSPLRPHRSGRQPPPWRAGGHCCPSLYCEDISGACCCVGCTSGRQGSPVLSAHSPHFPPLPHIPALPLGPCIPLQKPPHLPPTLPEPPWAVLGAAWDLGRGGGHHGLSEGMKGREGQEAGSVPEDICFRWESKCLPWCLVLGPSFFLPILVSPSPPIPTPSPCPSTDQVVSSAAEQCPPGTCPPCPGTEHFQR